MATSSFNALSRRSGVFWGIALPRIAGDSSAYVKACFRLFPKPNNERHFELGTHLHPQANMRGYHRSFLISLITGMLLSGCATHPTTQPITKSSDHSLTVAQAQIDSTLPMLDSNFALVGNNQASSVKESTDNNEVPAEPSPGSQSVTSQSTESQPSVSPVVVSDTADQSGATSSAAPAGGHKGQDRITRTVRWGGTIVRVENLASQQTLLEIVSRPLRSNGRPLHNDRSYGRFFALVDEFLDPQIVTADRDFTVIGSLAGRMAGKVGEADYVFPLVSINQYTYWKKPQEKSAPHFPHWNQHPFWIDDPLWRNWYLRQLENRPK